MIIGDRGFTVSELAQHRQQARPTIHNQIIELLRKGKIKHIGYRPGRCGAKVYEVVAMS
jgi:hypothetical protein